MALSPNVLALDSELQFARKTARAAGCILTRYFRTGLVVEMKGFADPVTKADRESEAFIRAELARDYPDDGLDGEEEGRQAGRSGRVWVIDPLDGTANYSAGNPRVAVVLALCEEKNPEKAILNVTYDPFADEMYWAAVGSGAFIEDSQGARKIEVSANTDLARALTHIHFSNKREYIDLSLEVARRVTEVAPHARNFGSTALAQAYVASGRLDSHLKVVSGDHDVVGGNLLVEEAGGVISDLDGHAWRRNGTLLAASRSIYEAYLKLTRGIH